MNVDAELLLTAKYNSTRTALLRLITGALLCTFLSTLPLMAQRAQVYNVGSMPDNSIVYALPVTKIYVQVSFEKVDETPGELALYAQRYLGISNALLQPVSKYELKGAQLGSYGVPDDEHRYSVKFGRRHDATNVTLTPDGLLLGINSPDAISTAIPRDEVSSAEQRDRVVEMSVFPPEYIQATTVAKKAEIAANEIYRLRESRTNIISGQSEQPFTDGKAMQLAIDRLDTSERVLVEHFTGHKATTSYQKVVSDIDITGESKIVAFRFCEQYGLLPADDLRGEPIYLEIKIIDQAADLDEREQKKLEKHLRNGIVYRVPGVVKASLVWRGHILNSTRVAVAQLGSLEALDTALFTNRDKTTIVEFYNATGSIKRVDNRDK